MYPGLAQRPASSLNSPCSSRTSRVSVCCVGALSPVGMLDIDLPGTVAVGNGTPVDTRPLYRISTGGSHPRVYHIVFCEPFRFASDCQHKYLASLTSEVRMRLLPVDFIPLSRALYAIRSRDGSPGTSADPLKTLQSLRGAHDLFPFA